MAKSSLFCFSALQPEAGRGFVRLANGLRRSALPGLNPEVKAVRDSRPIPLPQPAQNHLPDFGRSRLFPAAPIHGAAVFGTVKFYNILPKACFCKKHLPRYGGCCEKKAKRSIRRFPALPLIDSACRAAVATQLLFPPGDGGPTAIGDRETQENDLSQKKEPDLRGFFPDRAVYYLKNKARSPADSARGIAIYRILP